MVRAHGESPESAAAAEEGASAWTQTTRSEFDVRTAFYFLVGIDLTEIEGLDEITALTLIRELGTDFTKWPTMKHFTS